MAREITPEEFADAFEAHRAEVRKEYTTAISDAIEAAAAQFILADQQEIIVADAAYFAMFFCCMKLATTRGHELTDKKELMQGYRHLMKFIEREIPGAMLELANAAAEEEEPNE